MCKQTREFRDSDADKWTLQVMKMCVGLRIVVWERVSNMR